MSRPSLGRGVVLSVGMDPLGDFVTLQLIRGCTLGPLEASVLGGKRLPRMVR